MDRTEETIAAQASAPGVGGIGIVRVSGPQVGEISRALLGKLPDPRFATTRILKDANGCPIDQAVAVFFQGPHSYTGQDTLELHCHGSPIVLDQVLERLLDLGVRLAKPGEFTERAFLNGRMDLAQAEAVADLINSQTQAAARSAFRSLSGEFSKEIENLRADIEDVRVLIEANIDFSDEPVDVVSPDEIADRLGRISGRLGAILDRSRPGALLARGAKVVIAGLPNAGKSSLLNALAGADKAIVSATPGTTRDLIEVTLDIGGLPVHMVDTAGLRATADEIEAEGVRRANHAIADADLVLVVLDDSDSESHREVLVDQDKGAHKKILVFNKADLTGRAIGVIDGSQPLSIAVSVRDVAGLDLIATAIRSELGFADEEQSVFMARRRHLDSLERTLVCVDNAAGVSAIELAAEELRLAHAALGEITGAFSSEDLLGEIFSSFCIGK